MLNAHLIYGTSYMLISPVAKTSGKLNDCGNALPPVQLTQLDQTCQIEKSGEYYNRVETGIFAEKFLLLNSWCFVLSKIEKRNKSSS